MPLPPEVEAEITLDRSTLLFVDMQRRHLDVGGVGYHLLPADRAELVVARGAVALRAAREAGMPVVHVASWSRERTPWGPTGGRNPFFEWHEGKPIAGNSFGCVRRSSLCVEGSTYAEIMPPVSPLSHKPVLV